MSIALKDQNSVSSIIAVLNTDTVQGTNVVRVVINSINNRIKVNNVDTINFTMVPLDPRDSNYVGVWAFEGTDHLLYPAVANASGELLVSTS